MRNWVEECEAFMKQERRADNYGREYRDVADL